MTRVSAAFRNLAVCVALVLASVGADAATVTFNNVANSVNRGGVYSGFYALTIDSLAVLAMCDSRYSYVNPPTTWTADVWTYADIQGGAIGKFNNPSTAATLVKYSQTGWLYSQLTTLLPTDYAGHADVQEAIWKIMVPSYALVGAGASAWYTAATGGLHDAFNWSSYMRVVTADPLIQNSVDVQEFLIPAASTVVPVPAAVWLLGSGLAGLGVLRRRQQRD